MTSVVDHVTVSLLLQGRNDLDLVLYSLMARTTPKIFLIISPFLSTKYNLPVKLIKLQVDQIIYPCHLTN